MTLDNRLRFCLAGLLLGVALLFYSPNLGSADGQALLAVTTATLRHGTAEIGVMGAIEGQLPLQMSRMGVWGVDGALYSKKGPTPSLFLAPLVLLADMLPWLDTRATAMLFNPLITTLTALALYTFLRWLAFRPRTALVTALIYGLATTALVYTKTLFGEPLAALLLLVAVMGAWKGYNQQPVSASSSRWLALSGLSLGLLLGVNLVYALVVPVVGLWMVLVRTRYIVSVQPKIVSVPTDSSGQLPADEASLVPTAHDVLSSIRIHWRPILTEWLAFLLPILAALALLGLYNWARFGSPGTSGYHFEAGEGFTQPLLLGLYGLTFSPYRGLFWYNPVLLLAIPGWLRLRRKAAGLAWLALALVGLQLLLFAAWWSWHGGIVWGPRFLLPVLPLLALPLAPLVEAAWSRRLLAGVLIGFTLLSFGVQLLGALYSLFVFTGYLYTHYYTGIVTAPIAALSDELLYNPGLSPILGHLALAVAGWPLEPAWAANGVDGVLLLTAVVLIGLGLLCLLPRFGAIVLSPPLNPLALRGHASPFGSPIAWRGDLKNRFRRILPPRYAVERGPGGEESPAISSASQFKRYFWHTLPIALIFSALNVVVARQSSQADDIRALEATLQPPGTVVAASALFGDSLLDMDGRWRAFTTNAPTAPDDFLAVPLWQYARQQGPRLWLLTWFPPADAADWQARDLWQTAAFVTERTVPNHRALLFDLAPALLEHDGGYRFGDIQLEQYGVTQDGETLKVTVSWSALAAPGGDYSWFIHLLDADGKILAQQDRQPQGGYMPTSGWEPGTPVIDRLAFIGAFPEPVRLRIGWLDPATGERLPASDAGGTPLPDGFVVLAVKP